ncbi:MAG: YciI family protein [Chthoniobacteraceae bacterium]
MRTQQAKKTSYFLAEECESRITGAIMKHFVVEITYTAPSEAVAAVLERHRAYLQKGYEAGLLLMSGPQNPKTGGMIIARAESLDAIESYFANDPYQTEGVGKHRFIEFVPVKQQPFMVGWIEGK